MKKLTDTETYHELFDEICKTPRYSAKQLSIHLNGEGRGKKYSTTNSQIRKMYERGVSLYPNLVLRTFENCPFKAYLLKVRDPANFTKTFYTLKQNERLSYVLLLSGPFDFFVTSMYDLNFGKDLRIMKKSISYTPIYTIPRGWRYSTDEILAKMADSTLEEGKIERKIEDWLPWTDTHFRIYEIFKNNIQLEFAVAARKLGLSQDIVRKGFYKSILPFCNVAHYFFPKGYNHYHKSFIVADSNHEMGLVRAFSELPCTTYVFPLEEELLFLIFHENINDLMLFFKKIEEKRYIEKYFLCIPLYFTNK